MMKNDVWDVVPILEGKSVVTSKWIYKIKHAIDDSIEKYKARFVVWGFSQKEGIDYDTSTKARIFPRRFSTFLTFWCKIGSNRNKASLYPRLAVAVSTESLIRRCIHG